MFRPKRAIFRPVVHDSLHVFYTAGLRDTTSRSKRVAKLNKYYQLCWR